jgi:hypothetical protein
MNGVKLGNVVIDREVAGNQRRMALDKNRIFWDGTDSNQATLSSCVSAVMDIDRLCSPLRCRFIDFGKELRVEIV